MLQKLFSPTKNSQVWNFWLSLSLGFTLFCGYLALREGFSSAWIVQDDARQHVFWMLRYLDPQLFPNDLIADYFQSVAPVGYTSLYKLAATVGIHPLVFNKLLPPVIGLIASWYGFLFCKQILPLPLGCFITSVLLNQALWMKDDMISGTPRAFVYPFLLAFLYYLAKRSLIPCAIAIALLGLFYPQCVFLASGMLVLQLFTWQGMGPRLIRDRQNYYFCGVGLAVAFVVMLPYALHVSEFGPTITRAEALALPDFYDKGRAKFFKAHFWDYIFGGGRSGLFPRSLYSPETVRLGFLFPILMNFQGKFPVLKQLTKQVKLLLHLIIVSVVMFALAHAVLFKLHLPSRYTGYSFRIILVIAAGIVLTAILDVLWRELQRVTPGNAMNIWIIGKKLLVGLLGLAIAIAILFYPGLEENFPNTQYRTGSATALYEFFQQQPKDIMIASLVREADNLPTFSQRSVLVSGEYAIPYHMGYYRLFRQRAVDLITAQYSSDIELVREFVRQYKISFWLLESASFNPDAVHGNKWLRQHKPVTQNVIASLRQGNIPALIAYQDRCRVFFDGNYTVIDANCILEDLM
ncbi:hypothetical protein Xen7305DRAFT_00025910 [Xenococcus sp. PCC 7305]|uniref:hypothetical protein n=1 Tax=Xenococcus sp. PCC 7305 TaxID=102125 RepID=UPI0002AC84BD|nr:hypothetical protein [Xenococcus sp. PCC 7305]ELS02873.1 hypothetical protein Xen7305DRAFT_00025910 [Xenococcus sp. PCC 7305]